jgi:hypothetical protein
MQSFKDNLIDKGFFVQQIECHVKEYETVTEPLIFNMIHTTENNINLIG